MQSYKHRRVAKYFPPKLFRVRHDPNNKPVEYTDEEITAAILEAFSK